MVAGGVIYYFGMEYVGGAVFVIGFLGFAMYGGTLMRMSVLEPPSSVPGIEDLPRSKDVEVVLIDTSGDGSFLAVDNGRAKQIKKCIGPKITRKIQLRDKWGGEWEIRAIRTNTGHAEFCIKRVYYGGRSAQTLLRLLEI